MLYYVLFHTKINNDINNIVRGEGVFTKILRLNLRREKHRIVPTDFETKCSLSTRKISFPNRLD